MNSKKNAFAERVAAHLLAHGLSDCGIRALAKTAGTSDRMLIYYFGSKDQLIRDAMSLIVDGLATQLDNLVGTERKSRKRLLEELTQVCSDTSFLPMVQLWFEVVGLAARDVGPYKTISHDIAGVFVQWIERHIKEGGPEDAADLFAHLEGRMLLHVVGWPG
jgi:AcrR family transcriptional regulator